jgi:hypothetical protein
MSSKKAIASAGCSRRLDALRKAGSGKVVVTLAEPKAPCSLHEKAVISQSIWRSERVQCQARIRMQQRIREWALEGTWEAWSRRTCLASTALKR